MHDSGQRQSFNSGAVRDTADGKPRPDLISPHAQMREGEWMREGAEKYDERNWEKGIPISRCIASLERHLNAYKLGKTDEDHMAAIRTNASFIIHYEEEIKAGRMDAEIDDMPKYEQQPMVNYGGVILDEVEEIDPGLIFGLDFANLRCVPPNTVIPMPDFTNFFIVPASLQKQSEFMARKATSDHPRDRRCYIAGPMRGYPNYNFPAFLEVGEAARRYGFEVLSPAELEMQAGFDPISNPDECADRIAQFEHQDWLALILRDLGCILALDPSQDSIVVLPGWEKSTGAVAEVMLARWMGLSILDARDFQPLHSFSAEDVRETFLEYLTHRSLSA